MPGQRPAHPLMFTAKIASGEENGRCGDGVRVRFSSQFEDQQSGWFLARKSNTEPILVMRVEAVNQSELSRILNLIERIEG